MGIYHFLAVAAGLVAMGMSLVFKTELKTRLYYLAGGAAFVVLGLFGPEDFSREFRIAIVVIPVTAVLYGLVSMSEKSTPPDSPSTRGQRLAAVAIVMASVSMAAGGVYMLVNRTVDFKLSGLMVAIGLGMTIVGVRFLAGKIPWRAEE